MDTRRFKEDTIVNMTSLTMSKVVPKDAGEFAVTLENPHGKCYFSIKLIVIDKPGPPTNLKVTEVSEKHVALKWGEPETDGGSDVTGYVIEVREAIRRAWQKAGAIDATEKRQFTVTPLLEGQQYMFRVAAENECGVGE
jgi:titin